ncbi:hypothetical protein AB0J20_16410 [Micromonospora costi]|uniref:hypothetical protein n=1 Tax=Micromonospora costi TaxID=1530042 RepID=UPI003401395F
MKTRPRDIGTRSETAVVRYLQANGFPHAERRSLRGALDAGDITGTPGVAWEVKGGDAARTASDLVIEKWMAELTRERENAKADVGILVVQRAGVGPGNAGRWWAYMTAFQLTDLMGVVTEACRPNFPVRMLLADAVTLLRAAGYGQPDLARPVVALHDDTPHDDTQEVA